MKPNITKITDEWIKENLPCVGATKWWDKKERNPIKILKLLIKDKKYSWANWFIVRIMQYRDYVSYAVYAVEQVLDIYEREYPDDKRPQQEIEAAKRCIKNPSEKNKTAADAAAVAATTGAADAADTAVAAVATAAAAAAVAAAHSAYAIAAVAAADAAHATYVAVVTTATVVVADAAHANMQLKILDYGMKLLGEV